MREAFLYYSDHLRFRQDAGGMTQEEREDLAVAGPDKRDRRQPVVYYCRIGYLIKIGTTFSLGSRMMALQPDELLALEPGSYDTERERLQQFAASKAPKGSEYFFPDPPLMEHIGRLAEIGWEPDNSVREEVPGLTVAPCPKCELLAMYNDGLKVGCHGCGHVMTLEGYAAYLGELAAEAASGAS